MTHIPQAGNHGLMLEIKLEEAACLRWDHSDPQRMPGSELKLRDMYRPDTQDTCLCTPHSRGVPRGFSTQDGPYVEKAEVEIRAVMELWGQRASLEQRLEWYDESAEEERADREPIWVD